MGMASHNFFRAAFLAAPLLVAASGPGAAQAIVSTGQSFVNANLLSGEREPDGTRLAGLHMVLEPGWKTYWRSPGETGIPPQLDWSGSGNVDDVEVLWPRPEVFTSFGYQTIGYSERVIFPVRITPVDPALPVQLELDAIIGVCKDLCVLEQVQLTGDFPPDLEGKDHKKIARAIRAVPKSGAEAGLTLAECRVSGAGKDRTLDMTVAFDQPLNDPVVLVEGTSGMWVHGLETSAQNGEASVTANVTLETEDGWVDRSAFRITVLDGFMSADIQGCAAPS